tara:strand:+ start:4132 stop:5985 length:1854 start_codon:yes stop_codon:yes gene_type:complete
MAEMVKKDVRYLGKDFSQFRQNLITFAKQYFPGTYQDFNESSPGMMFMEMSAYIGDVLGYYSDQNFKESLLNSAQEDSNIIALSHLFGYKPKIGTPSQVKLDVYQLVPAIGEGENIAPDYRYALSIKNGMTVETEDTVVFRTQNNVDFNDNAEVSVYEVNAASEPTRFTLKKQVSAVSGQIVTNTFTFTDPKQYDKILLPEHNVLEILSVESDLGTSWHQTDYLAQDTIFEDIANIPFNDPELTEFRSTVPYILKLTRTPRRYVARVRGDLRTELQFGAGISSDADEEIIPNPKNVGAGLEYLRRTTTSAIDPTNFLATSTYGLAPNNETLTVTYTVGGDVSENIPANTLTKNPAPVYLNDNPTVDLADTKATLAVNNAEPALGGNRREGIEVIRQNAISAFAAQSRAVTREDYIARCYAMPAKYGSVAKAYVIQDTQQDTMDQLYPQDTISNPLALNLYTLGYDGNGNLTQLNQALKENLRTYLSNFRMLTDAINIKSAHIVNIGINFEIIPQPSANSNDVVIRCIDRLKTLFHIDRMQINGSINISNLISELDKVSGVQSVAKITIYNKFDGSYSNVVYDTLTAMKNNIIYPSLDPMIFEVKYLDTDIKGRVVKP